MMKEKQKPFLLFTGAVLSCALLYYVGVSWPYAVLIPATTAFFLWDKYLRRPKTEGVAEIGRREVK